MALRTEDFIASIEKSRAHFLRHLEGMTPDQIAWKPYPECKSVVETLQHLIVDDAMALESLQTMKEPNYDGFRVIETNVDRLLERLAESHQALTDYLRAAYGDRPLDAPACAWGAEQPAALAIAFLASEDYYHADQIAFIRMATDPDWDYYGAIYGAA